METVQKQVKYKLYIQVPLNESFLEIIKGIDVFMLLKVDQRCSLKGDIHSGLE